MRIHVNRQLMGVEDIVWGVGTVEQTRNGQAVLISKISSIDIPYTNTTSGLTAITVEEAIDEVEDRVETAETKLATIEEGATGDQTGAEIKSLYEAEADTNAYTDSEKAIVADTYTATDLALAIGNINSPLLDLPLKNSLAMKAGVGSTTFSRASEATYLNRYGRLTYAPIDEPRFEKDGLLIEGASTNLLTYSNEADLQSKVDVTVAPNTIVAPDGTLTADAVTHVDAGGAYNLRYGDTVSGTIGVTYTASIWIKCDTPSTVTLDLNDLNSSVKNIDTEWQRFSVIATATNTRRFLDVKFNEDKVYHVAFAQVEELPFASSYIPSTDTFTSRASTATYYDATGTLQTAAIDVARNTYNPSDLTAPASLLLEDASTNLLLQSEDISSASWTKTNSTISANATTAPDGNLTADKIVESATTSTHLVRQALANVLTGNTRTLVMYAKKETRDYINLAFYGSAYTVDPVVTFDLTNGNIVDNSASTIVSISSVELPNGWYRVSLTSKADADGQSYHQIAIANTFSTNTSYLGDGTSGIYIYGAQLEQSSFPSSYIPTTTTAVTRSADVSSSVAATRAADSPYATTIDNLPDLSGGATFIMDIKYPTYTTTQYLMALYTSETDYFYIRATSNGVSVKSETDDVVALSASTPSAVLVDGVKHRVGVVLRTDGTDIYVDGELEATTTSVASFNQLILEGVLAIGSLSDTILTLNSSGDNSNLLIYDKALTAEEMRLA